MTNAQKIAWFTGLLVEVQKEMDSINERWEYNRWELLRMRKRELQNGIEILKQKTSWNES